MGAQDNARLALRLSADRLGIDGAWWPRSRVLAAELPTLHAVWPAEDGYISRIVYCPSDWEDQPRAVAIANRRGLLKATCFRTGERHYLVLRMLDGKRRSLIVVPAGAAEETAMSYLRHFDPRAGR
jgi:hypothetical protein